ncbi:MAG: ATP-binding protein [Oscillospiraceae bacterium]|nr:ATP-binding protein [Oscillospiraceae bacterium]
MVQLLMGPKGTGKTKTLVELVRKASAEEHGDVVCIEKDKNLTYDIPYTARLIHASEYGISTNELLKGFISGLHAGNYDITHIFIDNFYKMLSDSSEDAVIAMLQWIEDFGESNNISFTISATADPNDFGEKLGKYYVTHHA